MSEESEIVDSRAGEKNAPTSALEAKNGSTDPPAAFNPGAPITSIRDHLARIVHKKVENMERGESELLSEQHNSMLQQLASLSVSSSPAASVTCPSQTTPTLSPLSNLLLRMQQYCPHQRL